jgi:hypothetical protein
MMTGGGGRAWLGVEEVAEGGRGRGRGAVQSAGRLGSGRPGQRGSGVAEVVKRGRARADRAGRARGGVKRGGWRQAVSKWQRKIRKK